MESPVVLVVLGFCLMILLRWVSLKMTVEGDIVREVYRDLYRAAFYVFLRTYTYDPHLEPRSEFPSRAEVVTGFMTQIGMISTYWAL